MLENKINFKKKKKKCSGTLTRTKFTSMEWKHCLTFNVSCFIADLNSNCVFKPKRIKRKNSLRICYGVTTAILAILLTLIYFFTRDSFSHPSVKAYVPTQH